MPPPTVRGIHLVGSIPLATNDEVFRTICKALPHHIRRLPDGETGERWNFAQWQLAKIGQWPVVFNGMIRRFLKYPEPDPPAFSEAEKRNVLAEMEEGLEVGYDIVALESYAVFKRLKDESVIPKDVRFLVTMPTPVTVTALFIRKEIQVQFEKVYEAALMRALERVFDTIPNEELSIQWDCPLEFAMIDKAELENRDIEPWWESGVLDGAVSRLARLCGSVKEGVEVGVHLCYGDMRGKHFVEPKDAGSLVGVARGLLDRCNRGIDFIHVPIPKDRTDDQYFEPLRGLLQYIAQGRELCLGLVHPDDLEGTRERIRAAGKVVPSFSISSECGLGRKPDVFRSVLEIASAVAEPVDSN